MLASEMLQRARKKIRLRRNWIQGMLSSDNNTKFCALGALSYVQDSLDDEICYELSRKYLFEAAKWEWSTDRGMANPVNVNDGLWPTKNGGHKAVLLMYDIAISMALSDEAEANE